MKLDLADRAGMAALFAREKFERVINLGAQAGVRYSIQNPLAYIDSNVVGFANILEGCRHNGVEHLVYASTSSVYGANTKMPFSVHQNVDHPLSFYAATKKANELMAHTYAHLYSLPVTGLRFFTVYGPWGRPDMALFLFTKNILAGKPIDVFNYGNHRRDFTYIDDIAQGVVRAMDRVATANPDWNGDDPDPRTSKAPYRLYNIGNNAAGRADAVHRVHRDSVSARRRRRICCRCSRATFRTRSRMSTISCATSATSLRRRSRRACGSSWSGMWGTTGSSSGVVSRDSRSVGEMALGNRAFGSIDVTGLGFGIRWSTRRCAMSE